MASNRSKDNAVNAVASVASAAAAAVNPVFGALTLLLGDRLRQVSEEAIQATLRRLERKIDRNNKRIDLCVLDDSPEFFDALQSACLVIGRSHQRAKLDAAENIIVNALLKEGDPDKLAFNDLDFFVRALDRLSYGALGVLGILKTLPKGQTIGEVPLRKKVPEAPPQLVDACTSELHGLGFVEQNSSNVSGPDGSFLDFQLSEIGLRFVDQILGWSREEE